MTNTHIESPALRSLHAIMRRSSLPLLAFSGVLFTLLLLSYAFLLPRFTAFHKADGERLSPRETASYARALAANLSVQEEERVRLVMPATDALHRALKEEKDRSFSPSDAYEEIVLAASRIGQEASAVHISRFTIDGDRVTIEGDVRNVDTRSMTVLAAFVENIEASPVIEDLVRPSFTRAPLPDGSSHSPFVLSFRLVAQ